jgi:hypothetical protein
MNAQAKPPPTTAQRRCLTAAIIIVIAGLAGCGKSSSSPEQEARSYISSKGHAINTGRVDYEHVGALVGLGEIGKAAQQAHNQIDGFRRELFDKEASEKLKHATFELSEGANELKNAMGALVAYTRRPNPAAVERLTTHMQAARSKWNAGAEEIWHIANESGAMTLKLK